MTCGVRQQKVASVSHIRDLPNNADEWSERLTSGRRFASRFVCRIVRLTSTHDEPSTPPAIRHRIVCRHDRRMGTSGASKTSGSCHPGRGEGVVLHPPSQEAVAVGFATTCRSARFSMAAATPPMMNALTNRMVVWVIARVCRSRRCRMGNPTGMRQDEQTVGRVSFSRPPTPRPADTQEKLRTTGFAYACLGSIDVCIANDRWLRDGVRGPGLPLEALRSLAVQGSIEWPSFRLVGSRGGDAD